MEGVSGQGVKPPEVEREAEKEKDRSRDRDGPEFER